MFVYDTQFAVRQNPKPNIKFLICNFLQDEQINLRYFKYPCDIQNVNNLNPIHINKFFLSFKINSQKSPHHPSLLRYHSINPTTHHPSFTMISSQSKKLIITQALQTSTRQMRPHARTIQHRAAQQEFKMQDKFRNLQNPLEYLRNNKIQHMIDLTSDLSEKLQYQMTETSQFSKNIYKKVLSNQDYLAFFHAKDKEGGKVGEEHMNMEQILKLQRSLKQKAMRKNSENQDADASKDLFKKNAYKKNAIDSNSKSRGLKQYRHALSRGKQNIQENINRQIKFHHIKKLNTPQFDQQCKHIEFYNMLKPPVQQPVSISMQFNIQRNEEIEKAASGLKFSLIKDSAEYGEDSKRLFYYDVENISFQNSDEKEELVFVNQSQSLIAPDEKLQDEQILKRFVDFTSNKISLNNILDFAMKKTTPSLLASYYKLKAYHYDLIEKEKRDDGLDGKYAQLLKKYEDFKEAGSKDKTRKMPLRFVDSQSQTMKKYQQVNIHKFFQNFQLVDDIMHKLSKLNKLRERAMKSYKKQSNLVILKNICLQIDEILFRLILLMLKGENFFLKENSELRQKVPIFSCSDLILVENKLEVERKILELIYANIEKFQVEKVDGVLKKTMITVYVEEREKNNRVYDILETRI